MQPKIIRRLFIRNLRGIFHRAPLPFILEYGRDEKKKGGGAGVGRDNKDDNVDDEEDNGWEGTDSTASDNGKIIIFANKVPPRCVATTTTTMTSTSSSPKRERERAHLN